MVAIGQALDAEIFLSSSLSAVLFVILVSAVIQDDLTCLVVGMYVATGDLMLFPSLLACFAGTLLGDFFWFFTGRLLGTACLERPPIKWVVPPTHFARAREFFERHGPTSVLLARFLPLIRTPIQVAAGLFTTKVSTCVFYFTIAAVVYAPTLVIGTAVLGNAVNIYSMYEQYGHFALLGVAILLWLILVASRIAMRRRD
jgi:membrane protein DedA with SNARE-associated domain